MRKIYCPQCYGAEVYKGDIYSLAGVGVLLLLGSILALGISFPGPLQIDWETFVPLEHENGPAMLPLILGILMIYSGTKDRHKLMCGQCGYEWETPKPRRQYRPSR